jgi:hypothetical protein
MINKEILGGLYSAIERGESLKRAMMTLYNSGYKKEEIEECAKVLVENNKRSQTMFESKTISDQPGIQPQILHPPIRPIPGVQPLIQQPVRVQKQELHVQKTLPSAQVVKSYPVYAPVQRISYYGGEITPREKAIIIILLFLLAFLIAILGLIFLFKQEIINFFGNLFGQ